MTYIQHIGIVCSDIEKSERFYIENFGLEKHHTFHVPSSVMDKIFGVKSAANIIALKAENSIIELFDFYEAKNLSLSMGRITHISLFVKDSKACAEKLRENGVDIIEVDREEGRVIYFAKDPDGVLIELKE